MMKTTPLAKYKMKGLDCVCGNLRMAARAITRKYDDTLRPVGLTANQLGVLWAVAALGPVTVRKLATKVAADESTLTRNLKLLAHAGLIAIEPGEDRREKHVSLTQAGEALMNRALPLWEAAQREVTEFLGASGVTRLNRSLLDFTRMLR